MSEEPQYYPVADGKYVIGAWHEEVDGELDGWVRAIHAGDEHAQAKAAQFLTDYANCGASSMRVQFQHRLTDSGVVFSVDMDDTIRCDGAYAQWDTDLGGWVINDSINDDCYPIMVVALLDTGVPVYERSQCWTCGHIDNRRISA